jgi:predicted GNAT family acetyltransferase
MQVVRHESGEALLRHAGAILEEAEAENGLMLGICAGPPPATDDGEPTWISVDDGAPIAAAVRTPPFNLVVSRASREAMDAVARHLHGEALPGVIGTAAAASAFADAWTRLRGGSANVTMRQLVYELTRVAMEPRAPGALRAARVDESALVGAWISAFNADAGLPAREDGALQRLAAGWIANGAMFLWEDAGRPVSMATLQAPTRNGIRVSLVFTPRELRGRGYASACVSAVSARALASGRKLCTLYTDAANPTSNAIYQRIGYRPVCESLMIGLEG